MPAESFDWAFTDRATYELGNGEGAVRLARTAPSVAVDIETAGLGPDSWDIKAVSLGTGSTAHVLDPHRDRTAIQDALAGAGGLVFHNSPFDVPLLVGTGLMRQADVSKVHDTLVSARLAYPGERVSKGLGAACERYLGPGYASWKTSLEQGFRAATGKTKSQLFRELGLHSPAYVAYSGFDIVMTARLKDAMPAAVQARTVSDHPFKVSGDPAYLDGREQTVNRMLLARTCSGIEIDLDVVDELKAEMAVLVNDAEVELAGFGVDTGLSRELMKRDLVRELADRGLLPRSWPLLKNGEPSADKRWLERLAHPAVDAMIRRSQADRFSSDYADKLVHLTRDGRIHPQVAVMVAVTGRSSYGDPPLQQFPPSTRRMLRFDRPATSLDWSSIEPAFFANVTGETELVELYESGGDLYRPAMEAARIPRRTAKTVLLAQLYGQGLVSLSLRLGLTEEATADVVEAVLGRLTRIRDVSRKIRLAGNALGLVQTMSGRIIPLDRDPRGRGYFGYKGINYVVQGSCYDLLAEALVEMHRQGLDDALYVAVHDELVVDTAAADQVARIMATPPPAFVEMAGRVPVLRTGRSDLGINWRAKE